MAAKNLIFIFFFLLVFRAQAEKALFEWGAFLGHGNTADYPASNEYRIRTLPVPYVRYRGDLLRSDEEDGTRFKMLSWQNFDLDFSFGGSLPTEGNNNQARLYMPTLDWTLEVGPRLLYYFLRNEASTIRVGFPLRYSYSTDFTTWRPVGYIFAPTLQLDFYNVGIQNLNLYLITDFNYYSEGEADYFFAVDPQYQIPGTRAAFDARAGYIGYNISAAAKYEIGNANFILGSRYSDYSESVNRESYLHKTPVNWTYFVGIGWMLFESEDREIR